MSYREPPSLSSPLFSPRHPIVPLQQNENIHVQPINLAQAIDDQDDESFSPEHVLRYEEIPEPATLDNTFSMSEEGSGGSNDRQVVLMLHGLFLYFVAQRTN